MNGLSNDTLIRIWVVPRKVYSLTVFIDIDITPSLISGTEFFLCLKIMCIIIKTLNTSQG
ncbi:MAG: hypothetical protein K0S61_379 [Anaerocolumna sp.]|jgi:hypothetical protein|nr:hypothetical protein [Anaerocolumna sp.]